MNKLKRSEEQNVRIPKNVEAGAKVAETCRKHGISESTYYAWKPKYAGMGVSQLRRLKKCDGENAELTKMYAELALVQHALQHVTSKKPLSQAQRMSVCLAMQADHGVRLRLSLTAPWLSLAAPKARTRRRNDTPLIEAMTTYLADNPGQGLGLLYEALRAEGHLRGKTRLWRVCCVLKMSMPGRGKCRLPAC